NSHGYVPARFVRHSSPFTIAPVLRKVNAPGCLPAHTLMVYANPVAGVPVSFYMIDTPIMTVADIVAYQLALVLRAITGAAYFTVFIAGDGSAAAGNIVTTSCADYTASRCGVAAAMSQFVANGCTNQSTNQ